MKVKPGKEFMLVQIDSQTKLRFKIQCRNKGVNIADAVEQLIREKVKRDHRQDPNLLDLAPE